MKKIAVCLVMSFMLCGCSNASTAESRFSEIVEICMDRELVTATKDNNDSEEHDYSKLFKELRPYRNIIESEDSIKKLYDVLSFAREYNISNIYAKASFSAFPYNKIEKNYYKLDISGYDGRMGINTSVRVILDGAGKITDCELLSAVAGMGE